MLSLWKLNSKRNKRSISKLVADHKDQSNGDSASVAHVSYEGGAFQLFIAKQGLNEVCSAETSNQKRHLTFISAFVTATATLTKLKKKVLQDLIFNRCVYIYIYIFF